MKESYIIDNRETKGGLSLFCNECNSYHRITVIVTATVKYDKTIHYFLNPHQVSNIKDVAYHCQNCEQDIGQLLTDNQKQFLLADRNIVI